MTSLPHDDPTAAAPSPAVAPPPGNPRFALFDSLRGVAAVLIVAFHVASISGALGLAFYGNVLAVLGPRSLTLFFVISGFLLYRPYVAARAAGRRPPRVARYARRRVLRIVPAYWVALTVLAIFPGIVGVFTGDWWRYYFFLQLYSHRTELAGIPVAWSLCVEVTFYIALPLWAMAVARLRLGSGRHAWLRGELAALALAAFVGIAVQVAGARLAISDLVAASLLGQIVWLAVGMALAVWSVWAEQSERESRAVRTVVRHPGLCWLGAAACIAGLTILLHTHGFGGIVESVQTVQPFAKTLAVIALTGALVALTVLPAVFGESAGGVPRRFLAAAPIAWLGLVSYGIYLWHLAVAEFVSLPSDRIHFSASGLGLFGKIHTATTPVLFVITLAITCALAGLSYYLVELPFLKRKETGRTVVAARAGKPPLAAAPPDAQ